MPQLQLAIFPDGVTHVTNHLAFRRQDGQVTYFNGDCAVKGCACGCVGENVRRTRDAADLSRRPTRQPEAETRTSGATRLACARSMPVIVHNQSAARTRSESVRRAPPS
jgi:hypothetical protein